MNDGPDVSHLRDERLQQGGGAFPHASHGEPEAAAAPLHDPVVSLVRVERLGEHRPDLQVKHMKERLGSVPQTGHSVHRKERGYLTSWMTF